MRLEQACASCRLSESRSRIVLPSPGRLVAIGEAPGAEEDAAGEGFVGRAGKTLDSLLVEHGLARGRDYGVANVVRCRPPENRKPKPEEIIACLPNLAEFLKSTQPKVILAVGATPTRVLGWGSTGLWNVIQACEREGYGSSLRWGFMDLSLRNVLERFTHACWIVPMPHTSPLAFNRNAPNGEKWAAVARRQVARAVEFLGEDHEPV